MRISNGLITSAAFGAALLFANAAWAQQSVGSGLARVVTAPVAIVTAPFTAIGGAMAPLATGRSVAISQPGDWCTTPVRTCQLREASFVGNGCSCQVPGGRARGTVTP